MTSARCWMAFGLMLAVAALSGCATTVPPADNPAVAVAPATRAPQAEVNRAALRDFADAIYVMQHGRYHDAERLLLKLTQDYPELPGPHANLGIVYWHLGKMTQAADTLKQAIALNSQHAEYYNQLGIVYRQSGQLEQARAAYESALRLDPNYAKAHLNIGILYDLYLRDLSQALVHYERYQTLLPKADAQVNKWIVDLKQRSKTAGKNDKRSDG